MASLMCTSLSLLVKVAPVSGQVKYTADTERQVGSFTGTLDPWKEISHFNSVVTVNAEQNIILIKQITAVHTSAVAALSFSATATASASSSLLTMIKSRKSFSYTNPDDFWSSVHVWKQLKWLQWSNIFQQPTRDRNGEVGRVVKISSVVFQTPSWVWVVVTPRLHR